MPTYKINNSGGRFRVVNVNKLPNKTRLQGLDIVYRGEPFVYTVSKFQDTRGLDTVYNGQPFYGHTDALSIPNSRISLANHPDVNNWLNTVTLNGGSASSSTISALNTFCNSIDSAGLRNKFYRLNLFCGNNLQTCLIPIYNSVSYNSPTLGFSVDTNNNFISTDYNETGSNGGLKGDGSTKYLNTGFLGDTLPTGNRHLSVYESLRDTNAYKAFIGVQDDGTGTYYFTLSNFNPGTRIFASFQTQAASPDGQTTGGHWIATDPASNSLVLYKNASAVASSSSAVRVLPLAKPIFVFAYNGSISTPTPGGQMASRLNAYSIGLGLSQQQATDYYNIMNTFQTALNRNV